MITVFVADDHQAFRQYICDLLKAVSCIKVVGQAEDGKQAVELVSNLKPEVVFMDVRMPVMNGIEATSLIKNFSPHSKIIAFSTYNDKTTVDQALSAGASGYLIKGCSLKQILGAITDALTGRTFRPQESLQNIL